jgi:glutamyl-tRNA reductase
VPEELRPYSYVLHDDDTVQHLMRVAAGADSLVLGEQQILAQVNRAAEQSRQIGAIGPVLSQAFALAVHAGKRARSETAISRHVTSISHAAVALARRDLPKIRMGLVVGAGEMAALAAQALSRQGLERVCIVNRTLARAETLAQKFSPAQALPWDQLPTALAQADVVITATRAASPVIRRRDLLAALTGRKDHPLVLVDIALPRDVEAAARRLPNLRYYDLDALETFVQANLARREAALDAVTAIIELEAERFAEWQRGHAVAPLIVALHQRAQSIAQREVVATLERLGRAGDDQQQTIERSTRYMVRQLLHGPTLRLKRDPAYADALRERLGLTDNS